MRILGLLRGTSAGLTRALAVCCALASASSCAPSAPWYEPSRARGHIAVLAGQIGKRPHGSTNSARAREYIVTALEALGFDVRVQVADAVDARAGLTARVANVIAVRRGASSDGIALVSHYDSVPGASGALDDGIGVAVSLEAARRLSALALRHSIYVLVTDAEEAGLMGARALVEDPDVRENVRAFLNFDGTGARGPGLLFQAGPGLGAPLVAWARGASRPVGGSFSLEIYRRLPNDTDFTVLATTGASGLNFAPVGDSYAYHTDRDVPSRVDDFTLRHETINAVSTVLALDATAVPSRDEVATHFALAGRRGVAYGAAATRLVAMAAVAVAGIAWGWLTFVGWRDRGSRSLVVTAATGVAMFAAAVAAMAAVGWTLRVARAELHPWYAAPGWLFATSILAGLLAAAGVVRLCFRLPGRWRPWSGPLAVWWITLPVWAALTVALHQLAPAASYLTALPLAAAGLAVGVSGRRRSTVRLFSALVAVLAAHFWLPDTFRLLGFMVALFGWLPIVTPFWLYAAVLALAGLMMAPPVIACATGGRPDADRPRRRSARRGTIAVVAFVTCGAFAGLSSAYTDARPHRRAVRFVQDDVAGRAWWEVGGYEAALALEAGAPDPGRWERTTDPPDASARLGVLSKPIRFRTSTEPRPGSAPAELTASARDAGSDFIDYELTVKPYGVIGLRLALPGTTSPAETSIAGVVQGGRWAAAYAAIPAEGLQIRLRVPSADRSRLDAAVITLLSADPPGAIGSPWPAWLGTARTTWTARSVWVVSGRPAAAAR